MKLWDHRPVVMDALVNLVISLVHNSTITLTPFVINLDEELDNLCFAFFHHRLSLVESIWTLV